jgi:hypothetical protein
MNVVSEFFSHGSGVATMMLGMKKKAQNTGGVCFARVGWGCENEWNEFARNCMQYSFETSCNLTWAAFNVMYYGFLCH